MLTRIFSAIPYFKVLSGIFIGDCCGSPYEGRTVTGNKIGSYTDDTEQALGIVLWLKGGKITLEGLRDNLKTVYSGRKRGYGAGQADFLEGKPHRTDSFGNGASMRVAPVGVYGKNPKQVIQLATLQSQLTHNHPDAIAGAVTIALATHLIYHEQSLDQLSKLYPGALLPQKGKDYVCSLQAIESVPPALEAYMSGNSFQDTLERALAFGNDTDTIAAMACALAAVRYGVPKSLMKKVRDAHPDNLLMYKKIIKL
ncbi:ADP-ribosylglycohydrolase family protein [bacterium]|nr:ADP-ribosylglycohydrolase family protein [bacterium]